MKLKINIIIGLILLTSAYSYGQMEQYDFKRELQGITDQWHKVTLPDEVLATYLLTCQTSEFMASPQIMTPLKPRIC